MDARTLRFDLSVSYFITDGSAIKIGKASSIDGVYDRLDSLQTGNPNELRLVAMTNIKERVLHSMFYDSRIRGEWFSASRELIDFINGPDVTRVDSKNAVSRRSVVDHSRAMRPPKSNVRSVVRKAEQQVKRTDKKADFVRWINTQLSSQ